MKIILITGAAGQIGSELTSALRDKYGNNSVVAAWHKHKPDKEIIESGPCCVLDVRDQSALESIVNKYKIDTIFHLASLLSAVAEDIPQMAWDININGLINVLEIARVHHCSVFFPSSIGVFGPLTPAENTPQDTIQRPNTMYGITKVSGELLCDYYHTKFSVDTRSVRYPGLISHKTLPGGGTTDYAVHIFYAALKKKPYDCFLEPGTRLDMMYMPDAIKAAIQLMETDSKQLIHRNGYNITSMSVAPKDIAEEIKKHIPEFKINYVVDPVRQSIAESWPRHMDDSTARTEWNWQPDFDLNMTVDDMLKRLSVKLI